MTLKIDLLKLLIPKTKLGSLKLGEEDQVCIRFAQYLRELTLQHDFPYVWFHVPNQFAMERPLFGLKQSWMGRIAGIPDYIFLGEHNCFSIEFKSSKGKISSAQQLVQKWFAHKNINFYIAYNFEEAKKIIMNEWKDDTLKLLD